MAVAFVPNGTLAITPLQAEGMATGLVFVTGLVTVWFALSERAPDDEAEDATTVLPPADATEAGLFAHPAVPEPAVRRPRHTSR